MITTSQTKVVALDGLDSAIIGTANLMQGGEVVAYDFNMVVELIESMDWSKEDFIDWWEDVSDSLPDDCLPVFINLDNSVRDEIAAQRNGNH